MWDIPPTTILLLANHLVNMPSLFPLKGLNCKTKFHIAANYICIEVQELQYEYFFDSLKARSEDEFVSNLDALNEELNRLDYSEEAGMAWTAINTFRVNFIKNDQTALEKLAHDADAYISEHEDADAVPQVYISATRALHITAGDKVSKEEVDRAYSYLLRFSESENLRSEFFQLLDESTEAGNR